MGEERRNLNEYRDPDYDTPVKTERKPPFVNHEQKLEKVKSIIQTEFKNEMINKQESLTFIDERLLEARKIFHRLRYAIVNNYYNPKKFELSEDDIQKEITSQINPIVKTEVHKILTNEQKRIHPAVKSVLAEKLTDDIISLNMQRPQRKRFKTETNSQNVTIATDANVETLRPVKEEMKVEPYNLINETQSYCDTTKHTDRRKSNHDNHKNRTAEKLDMKIPMYVEPKGLEDNVLKINFGRINREKQKFRIIIGNTSKFMEPHSVKERVTHRWLLYVRGPPSSPDISHIVDSITIQLHDSYIPHNIIKIKSYPFHLSRRGWGEFPVKLRIHFKNEKLNKPINLVHNLKLDRLHTGLQTLGEETVVDVWLYTTETMINEIPITPNHCDTLFPKFEEPQKSVSSHEANLTSNVKMEVVEKHELNLNSVGGEFCLEPFVKVKEEPMDVDDEYTENCHENIFKDDISFDHELYQPSTVKSEDCPSNDLFKISFKVCDTLFNDNSSSVIDRMDTDLFKSCYSGSSDTKESILLSEKDRKLLETVFEDHCYFSSKGDSQNVPSVVKNEESCLYESNTMEHLSRVAGLHQIIEWFNAFNIQSPLFRDNLLNIKRIIELNRLVVEKISNSYELDEKKLFYIQNIITVNKIIISTYVKELSVIIWNSNRRSLDEVNKLLNVVKDMSSINSIYFNLNNVSHGNSSLKISNSLDENENNAVLKAIHIIESLIRCLPEVLDLRYFVNLMLRRMPIIDESANIVVFQCLFPYTVINLDTYFSYSFIKKRSLLWTRAKMINGFLKKFFKSPSSPIWSTKQILVFGQYHGYYPVKKDHALYADESTTDSIDNREELIKLKELFESSSQINTKTLCCSNIFEPEHVKVKIEPGIKSDAAVNHSSYTNDLCYISDSSDDEVDVCDDDKIPICETVSTKDEKCNKLGTSKTSTEILPFENADEKILCHFIESVCSELGIILRNQNVGNGYSFGLVHKIILIAMKNFIEDLLRRSLAVKMTTLDSHNAIRSSCPQNGKVNSDVERCSTSYLDNHESNEKSKTPDGSKTSNNQIASGKIWLTSESATSTNISLRHIFEAMKTRREFDFLTNFGLGIQPSEYTGAL